MGTGRFLVTATGRVQHSTVNLKVRRELRGGGRLAGGQRDCPRGCMPHSPPTSRTSHWRRQAGRRRWASTPPEPPPHGRSPHPGVHGRAGTRITCHGTPPSPPLTASLSPQATGGGGQQSVHPTAPELVSQSHAPLPNDTPPPAPPSPPATSALSSALLAMSSVAAAALLQRLGGAVLPLRGRAGGGGGKRRSPCGRGRRGVNASRRAARCMMMLQSTARVRGSGGKLGRARKGGERGRRTFAFGRKRTQRQ